MIRSAKFAMVMLLSGVAGLLNFPTKLDSPTPAIRNLPHDCEPRRIEPSARLGEPGGSDLFDRGVIRGVSFSADGTLIVGSDFYNQRRARGFEIWNAESGKLLGTLPSEFPVNGVSLSPDGKHFAWQGYDGSRVFGVSDALTGKALWRVPGEGSIHFAGNDQVIAGFYSGPLQVLEATSGKLLHTLTEPGRTAEYFAVSHDGSTIVASTRQIKVGNYESAQPRIEVWNVAAGTRLAIVASRPYTFGTHRLAISADGRALAFSEGKRLAVVESATGKELWHRDLDGDIHGWSTVVFAPRGGFVLAGHCRYAALHTTTFELFDEANGLFLRRLNAGGNQFSRAAILPDGSRIVVFGEATAVCVLDSATGKLLPGYERHRDALNAVAISGDGETVITADREYAIGIWNRSNGTMLRRVPLRGVQRLALSDDGRRVFAINYDGVVLVDTSGGSLRRVFWNRSGLALTRDGDSLATFTNQREIAILDTASGAVRQTLKGHDGGVVAMAFSAAGSRLLSAARTFELTPSWHETPPPIPDDTLRLWDLAGGHEIRRWPVAAKLATLTPDGRIAIAIGTDNLVRRFNTKTGRELDSLNYHRGTIVGLAHSADGRRAATADLRTIVVWESDTGNVLHYLSTGWHQTTAIALSREGRWLVSAGRNGTALVWDLKRTAP